MSLRLKILLPVILLITAIVCSIAVIAYKESADALRESLYNNMQKQAENMATNSLSFARQVESDALRSASRPDVAAFLLGDTKDKQRLDATNAMLKELDETYPDITRIQILTPDGLVAASSNPSTVGSDFSKRDYFLVPQQQGKGYRAPAFVSTVTKSSVMVSSAPVVREGKVLGVLTCTISLDNYYRNYVQTINISETGFGYMINSKGEIILHREFDKLFKPDLPITPYLKQAAAAKESGVIDFISADGKRMIIYHVPSPSDNNTAIIQAEYDDVFGPLNTIRRTSIVISAVALLAGMLCVFLVVNPVVRALRNGAAFANQVKNGNLDGRLEVRRNDEIGSLAEALRSIPASLKGITGEYASLEERVENGELDAQGAAEKFQGDFAALVNGTNSILARFRTVLDNIPSPVMIMNGELRAIYMNRAGAQAAGMDWRNRTVADLFHLSAAEKLDEARTRQVSGEAEASFGGSTVEVQYNCIPLTDSAGKTRSLLLLLTDITAVKSAQRTMTEVAQGAFDIAHRVATASEELSAQVEQVSIGTTRQHELVSSTAAAMEQMNSSILEVARNSEQANEQAGMTRDNASQGAGLVSQVTEAMSNVNSTTGELRLSMEELGTKVDSIGAVMNVITDIADQTNLLALNAAIEAARAGEAGRGFSVVADEVRKLAEKTMLATREVEESIKGIQTATKVNLCKVEETSSCVEKATELTGRSRETLESILNLAQGNSTLISGIAAAIEQQSASSEEINRSIDDISQVATETAGGMEQAEGAVQELAALANQLNEQLQRLSPAEAA